MTQTRLPELPDSLKQQRVAMRLQTDGDLPFVCSLYASTRWTELEPTGWPEEMKQRFLQDQFLCQHRHYTAAYPGAAFGIVEVAGEPAGRLYLHHSPGDYRIVDISLLPAYRNCGYGAKLIEAVFAQARQSGSSVSIHVETNNPARRLYARLGFSTVGEPADNEVYQLMEWRPEAGTVQENAA